MLLPHPLNYISSKIGGVGGSACHRRGLVGVSSHLPEAPGVHFFLLYFHEPSDSSHTGEAKEAGTGAKEM